jgi:cobalt/nickel transport system permease protein
VHIPENYLSPSTCGVFGLVMVPVWAHCIKKVKATVPREKIAYIGVFAAFSFLLMMFNVPLPGGTTGHAVGGTLIAILLGPEAACLAVTVALVIQALLFGDGGVLALGANCFNMAFVLPFVGFYLYRFIRNHVSAPWGGKVGAVVGSYVGINVAALCASIEFGIQPLLFTDASGAALYCPYPLAVSIPAMLIPHLLVAGVVEAIATVAICSFVEKVAPDYIYENSQAELKPSKRSFAPVWALIAALVVLTPLGLLAGGTAWGEWGSEEIADVAWGGSALGYTPAGLADGWSWNALMPDYSLAGLPEAAGYILSAVIGVALLVVIFKIIGSAAGGSSAHTADPVA